MSATTTLAPPVHFLIRPTDLRARVGSLHAALPVEGGFRTACGAVIEYARTRRIEVWELEQAVAVIEAPGANRCSRCDRVGDAVDEP